MFPAGLIFFFLHFERKEACGNVLIYVCEWENCMSENSLQNFLAFEPQTNNRIVIFQDPSGPLRPQCSLNTCKAQKGLFPREHECLLSCLFILHWIFFHAWVQIKSLWIKCLSDESLSSSSSSSSGSLFSCAHLQISLQLSSYSCV